MACSICLILLLISSFAHARNVGPAIPIQAGDEPTVVSKVRVTDCRAVRGFVGAPVDGSLKSGAWDARVWEYHKKDGGVGVEYNYLDGDGLHLTLADDRGFNAVVVRGGIKARLFRDVTTYDDPTSGTLIHEFPGKATTSRAWFGEWVKSNKVSFFKVDDGFIADASFFRVTRGLNDLNATAQPLQVSAQQVTDQAWQGVAPAFTEETSITAVGVDLQIDQTDETTFTISINDPLNARLTLHEADYTVKGGGRIRIVCDWPDQVIPAGRAIAVAIAFEKPTKFQSPKLEQYRIPKERAIAEALEHRKFILHALYTPVSEARPWNAFNKPGDDEAYFKSTATESYQEKLRPWVREIVDTLNQCRALDPEGKDPIVRQMHEWIFRKILTKSPGGMPKFDTKFDRIDGVPEWASLVHQAWMQAREVPKWWLENRLAPNGEFGGLIGDDSDMYQNYAAFPMLERDGVGGMLVDAGARFMDLANEKNLSLGVNKTSMDPLHAYEEGMNHEALMAYWNYGDPIYVEQCMLAAKSTEKMTVVTSRGHRHFRNNDEGVKDVTTPGVLEREHGAHCLMWHPTMIAAWYNRHPLAMQWLSEWGDGWLEHMHGAEQGIAVKLPEDVTTATDPLPFTGGWEMVGSAFMFVADVTNDGRFIRPYTDYFTSAGKNTGVHFAEILLMGMLPSPQKTVPGTTGTPWNTSLYTTGDERELIAAMKKDIEELQRFGYMYTAIECFTDRVFLYAMINPSIAYTGGYTTRNKLNLSYAVSWNGFGTDYAALVTSATRDHLKVLLCNLSDKQITGSGRIWRLEPGEYELTFGPDADNDDKLDRAERTETITISKGDEFKVTLPPKVVQIVELNQKRKGEPIFNRADLAITSRELKLAGGKLSGVVHNIGVKDVQNVVVALVDKKGEAIQTKQLGKLAAPLDLEAKTIAFEFQSVSSPECSVILDPDNAVPEIFEANNRVTVAR